MSAGRRPQMRTLILNFKNYARVQGNGSIELARAAAVASRGMDVKVIVAPPTPMLSAVASRVRLDVYSQSVSGQSGEKTTGLTLPESVKAAGAKGTILNHSEARMALKALEMLVPRVRRLGLAVCLCARNSREAASLARFGSEYLAVEPPELIGSGVAVSRARPEVVEETLKAARRSGYKGKVLCGAGIVSGDDVRRAVELGADGVMVASSVVNARDWRAAIRDLAGSLI